MAAAVSIARWLLDEASSGTGPTTVADDQGPNDLTIDYSSGDAEWTSIAAGNGMDFTALPATSNTAVVELEDIATNGDIGSSLDGVSELSLILVGDIVAGSGLGSRFFAIGSNSGNTDFSLVVETARVVVRWDEESGGSGGGVDYVFPSGVTTIGVTVDTSEAASADRVKLYYDGVLQSLVSESPALTLNSTLDSVNSTNRSATIGNRPSHNRNVQGRVYYCELFNGILTATQHLDAHNALNTDNDANWDAPSGNTITATQAETGDTQSGALEAPGPSTVSAAQTETGDTQSAALEGVVTSIINAAQTETGDTQSAALEGVVTSIINAAQTETGDTQSAAASSVVQLNAPQAETGDTQSAALSGVLLSTINAAQTETGDTQLAAVSNVVQINAPQVEVGDTQSASISEAPVSNMSAAQTETGDTQSAAADNVIQLNAPQAEVGDTQSASISEAPVSNVTALQVETGDTQIAWVGLPPKGKVFNITVAQRSFKVTVAQRRFEVSA